jgi:hypothetical protein
MTELISLKIWKTRRRDGAGKGTRQGRAFLYCRVSRRVGQVGNLQRVGNPLDLALIALLRPQQITAQDDLHQQDRQELLKILTSVENAINAQDIEGLIV